MVLYVAIWQKVGEKEDLKLFEAKLNDSETEAAETQIGIEFA